MKQGWWVFLFVLLVTWSPESSARKVMYAMPPEPALSESLRFSVVEPTPPPPQPAKRSGGLALVVVGPGQFLDEQRRITYRQEFGGGGLAVGLLFGPLGAGANAAAVQNANEKEAGALRGRFPFTPQALMAKALQARGEASAGAQEARIVPSLHVTRDQDGRLIFWAIVDVNIGAWNSRYSSLVQGRVPLLDVAQGLPADGMANLEAAIQAAYARALDTIAADVAGTLTGFKPMKAELPALSPRFHNTVRYEHALLLEDRMIVRGFAGAMPASPGGLGFMGVLVMPIDAVKLR
ncbi:hypothetical protein [Lysobacter brunescens]|uniref:DUF541 domain-containing protein n=1 Tax=Lysobacter brunescens TaxID=262323 RepID=A0ABW2YC31_9GAMM